MKRIIDDHAPLQFIFLALYCILSGTFYMTFVIKTFWYIVCFTSLFRYVNILFKAVIDNFRYCLVLSLRLSLKAERIKATTPNSNVR